MHPKGNEVFIRSTRKLPMTAEMDDESREGERE
jgi:hypothetical protein